MFTLKLIWRTFSIYQKIKKYTCHHYYIHNGTSKGFLFIRDKHIIECIDCNKKLKFEDIENANIHITNSQNSHGKYFKTIRNGLVDGSVDVAEMDI